MTIARTSASGFAIAAASASPTGPIDANTDSKQYSRSSDGSRIAMDRQLARPSQYPWFEPWSTYTTREYLYYPRGLHRVRATEFDVWDGLGGAISFRRSVQKGSARGDVTHRQLCMNANS